MAVGTGYSVTTPGVVMRPILLALDSVNQSAPSGPAVIPCTALSAVGTAYSVIDPPVVMLPILLPSDSVNQSAPSGPAAIPTGSL